MQLVCTDLQSMNVCRRWREPHCRSTESSYLHPHWSSRRDKPGRAWASAEESQTSSKEPSSP
eukprot:55961-Eustigmatos_ZCMA.PRE.1